MRREARVLRCLLLRGFSEGGCKTDCSPFSGRGTCIRSPFRRDKFQCTKSVRLCKHFARSFQSFFRLARLSATPWWGAKRALALGPSFRIGPSPPPVEGRPSVCPPPCCHATSLAFANLLAAKRRHVYFARARMIETRSVSEGRNLFPRLRFGLRWDVPFQTARSIFNRILRTRGTFASLCDSFTPSPVLPIVKAYCLWRTVPKRQRRRTGINEGSGQKMRHGHGCRIGNRSGHQFGPGTRRGQSVPGSTSIQDRLAARGLTRPANMASTSSAMSPIWPRMTA